MHVARLVEAVHAVLRCRAGRSRTRSPRPVFQPAPRPSSSRPCEMMSSVAAMLASTAGWRYGMPVTSTPTRSRLVAWASAVERDPALEARAARSLKIGSKWSNVQPDSKRSISSAACQTASMSSHVVDCGAVLNAKRIASVSHHRHRLRPPPGSLCPGCPSLLGRVPTSGVGTLEVLLRGGARCDVWPCSS